MTDHQWDELVESFEVMKYGGDKDDPQRVSVKDIHHSSSQYRRSDGVGKI